MEPSISSLLFPLLIFLFALVARALFSFLETSITALRLFKLKELARTLDEYQPLFTSLETNPQRVLISILVANSLADVLTAVLAPLIMESLFRSFELSSGLGFSIGIGIATIAILIFGEIIPKTVAKNRSGQFFRSTIWLTNILFYAFHPFVTILLAISHFFTAHFRRKSTLEKSNEWVSSEREVRFLIDYIYEKGLIEAQKNEMLQNIFELGETPVREIMTPSNDIVLLESNASLDSVLTLFLKHHFSRLPVYETTINNIVGMVHIKDLIIILAQKESKPLKSIMRPILFVPESMKVNQLLKEFQHKQMHIAVVINEHGSITGLITLEDVLEEIVGDISDEHEEKLQKILSLQQGGWLVQASNPLDDISKLLNITFEVENATTLGGFITEKLQHLPQKGETITYKGYSFNVHKINNKRIIQIIINQLKAVPIIPSSHQKNY